MIVLRDRQHRPAVIITGLLIAFIILIYLPPVQNALGEQFVKIVYNAGSIILPAVGAVFSFLLARSYKRGEVLRQIWLFMGTGLLIWMIGETIYAYYDVIVQDETKTPWPSEADIFYIAGYIPLFIALILRFRSLGTTPERERVIPLVISFVLLVGVVSFYIFLPIVTDPDPEINGMQRLTSVLYPVGDLALAFGAMLILLVLTGGTLSRPWIYIVMGFVLNAISDLGYSYTDWQEFPTTVPDVAYLISYAVIVFGIYLQARLQKIL